MDYVALCSSMCLYGMLWASSYEPQRSSRELHRTLLTSINLYGALQQKTAGGHLVEAAIEELLDVGPLEGHSLEVAIVVIVEEG